MYAYKQEKESSVSGPESWFQWDYNERIQKVVVKRREREKEERKKEGTNWSRVGEHLTEQKESLKSWKRRRPSFHKNTDLSSSCSGQKKRGYLKIYELSTSTLCAAFIIIFDNWREHKETTTKGQWPIYLYSWLQWHFMDWDWSNTMKSGQPIDGRSHNLLCALNRVIHMRRQIKPALEKSTPPRLLMLLLRSASDTHQGCEVVKDRGNN